MATRDRELEAFKTAIDLRAFAASAGYRLDPRESCRGSTVMRKGGDKIIIKLDSDGHFVYFSVRDDRDNGSIIDFVRNRYGLNLGAVRKELRPWIGRDVAAGQTFPTLHKSSGSRLIVEWNYRQMATVRRHPYLENERGLPSWLLSSRRFAGRLRCDERGNAVFPHFDSEGLCGYEIKNRGFTGFAKGGSKGLWLSHETQTDNRLVLSESAIDALSYAALFPNPRARHASIGGQMSRRQPALLAAAMTRMMEGSEIVAAMDADSEGSKLAAVVRSVLTRVAEEAGRKDLRFSIEKPEGAKDWNDQLRFVVSSSSPTAPSPAL